MGKFTDGEIIISANSKESADKIADQIHNLDKYIKAKTDEPFDTSVTDIDVMDDIVYVKLCSNRYPNLIWQLDQILEMCKDLFKGEFSDFTGDYTVPENHIHQEFDKDGEEI